VQSADTEITKTINTRTPLTQRAFFFETVTVLYYCLQTKWTL